jgi:biopolymer transport protein ExbB/TolQ
MNTLLFMTDLIEKVVMLGLIGLSVWSVSIMIERRKFYKTQSDDYSKLKSLIEKSDWGALSTTVQASHSFLGQSLKSCLDSQKSELGIDRSFSSFVKERKIELEKGLSILATLGSNAPFIGLFGTVLGIIRAFAYLGSQSGSAAVMSGVSAALYATAMGLLVAIPAVVSFNVYTKKVKDLQLQAESLRDLVVAKKLGSQ